jgi:hypothetical protein
MIADCEMAAWSISAAHEKGPTNIPIGAKLPLTIRMERVYEE